MSRLVGKDRGYADLANAIILQAIDDYVHVRPAKYKEDRSVYLENGKNNRLEIVRFLYGDWYRLLTEVDPNIIMKEMLERRKRHESGLYERGTPKLQLDDETIT